MKIIFFLPSGVIEYPIPEAQRAGFHFGQTATAIRMAGYFMADTLYINHAFLVGMSFAPDDGPAPAILPHGQVLQ